MNKPSSYTFAALFRKEEDGRYSVRFPQLDGCFTEGDCFEAARQSAVDAMSLHLYGMEQDGEEIPDYVEEVEANAGETAFLVTAWMTPFRDEMENRAVKKTLTIPAWLNEAAEKRGVNYSQILQSALKDYLGVYHP
ncbi:MAG: type II toxin-antitoxin system HicB family antitoxin [Clostridia bacterium]|nr:type II toxin-antitoxin system HicB family antitoxin [Clostridia bacterium]